MWRRRRKRVPAKQQWKQCKMPWPNWRRKRNEPTEKRRRGRQRLRSWRLRDWSRSVERLSHSTSCCQNHYRSFLHLWNLHPQERIEAERKEKKKQKDKERKERLKKEGKLLTKTQKEARARAEATLRALQAQGENMTDSSFDERNSQYFEADGVLYFLSGVWSAIQRFNAKEEACLLW